MVKSLDTEQANRKEAEAKLQSLTRASKVNEEMLKNQLQMFKYAQPCSAVDLTPGLAI